jgi:hypothetical protein
MDPSPAVVLQMLLAEIQRSQLEGDEPRYAFNVSGSCHRTG